MDNSETMQNEEQHARTNGQAISGKLSEISYEDFFKDSPYRKERMINIQLPKTVHQKLLLIKQVKGTNMVDFVSNCVDYWFKMHGDDLKKDFNKLKNLF